MGCNLLTHANLEAEVKRLRKEILDLTVANEELALVATKHQRIAQQIATSRGEAL